MKTVQIAELEADPRAYVESLRNSEEMIVCDGEKPLARVSRINTENLDEKTQRLIAKGVLIPASKPMPDIWPMPAGDPVPDEVMEEVWRFVRGDD